MTAALFEAMPTRLLFSADRILAACREDINLEVSGWEERETELETKWRFSALLSLPWRPRLAASGGTTHVFDKVQPLSRPVIMQSCSTPTLDCLMSCKVRSQQLPDGVHERSGVAVHEGCSGARPCRRLAWW